VACGVCLFMWFGKGLVVRRDPFNSSLVAGGPCSRSVVACLALGDNVLSMKFASSPTMLPATIVDCHHHYLAPSEPFHAYINALGAPG
jgi:hypothetical protein